MDKVLRPERLETDPNSGEALKNGFIGNERSTTLWLSYHKETSTSSRYWRIAFLLQSVNISKIAPTMKQPWEYNNHFL